MDKPQDVAAIRTVERHFGALLTAALIGGFIIIGYPMSIGPAILIYDHSGEGVRHVIKVAYRPLEFVCDKNETARDLVLKWAQLWR